MITLEDLMHWVAREMPALDQHLCPKKMEHAGECLNAVTGLKLDMSTEELDSGARKYLNALQSMTKEERQEIERKARNGELS